MEKYPFTKQIQFWAAHIMHEVASKGRDTAIPMYAGNPTAWFVEQGLLDQPFPNKDFYRVTDKFMDRFMRPIKED